MSLEFCNVRIVPHLYHHKMLQRGFPQTPDMSTFKSRTSPSFSGVSRITATDRSGFFEGPSPTTDHFFGVRGANRRSIESDWSGRKRQRFGSEVIDLDGGEKSHYEVEVRRLARELEEHKLASTRRVSHPTSILHELLIYLPRNLVWNLN